MANWDMRRARIPMTSLYIHHIRAMGRKLAASSVESFLWMRMVVAVFHTAGTSLGETAGEDCGQDLAFFVDQAQVAVLDAVFARGGIGHSR